MKIKEKYFAIIIFRSGNFHDNSLVFVRLLVKCANVIEAEYTWPEAYHLGDMLLTWPTNTDRVNLWNLNI